MAPTLLLVAACRRDPNDAIGRGSLDPAALPTLSREAKETPDRPSSPPIKGAINDADWEVKFSDDDPDNPLVRTTSSTSSIMLRRAQRKVKREAALSCLTSAPSAPSSH